MYTTSFHLKSAFLLLLYSFSMVETLAYTGWGVDKNLSLIKLECALVSGSKKTWGSGFFVSPDGDFVTARHILPERGDIDANECIAFLNRVDERNNITPDYSASYKVQFSTSVLNNLNKKYLIGRLLGVTPQGNKVKYIPLLNLDDLRPFRCGASKSKNLLASGFNNKFKDSAPPSEFSICLNNHVPAESDSWLIPSTGITNGTSGGPVFFTVNENWPKIAVGIVDGGWTDFSGGVFFFGEELRQNNGFSKPIHTAMIVEKSLIVSQQQAGKRTYSKNVSLNGCELISTPLFKFTTGFNEPSDLSQYDKENGTYKIFLNMKKVLRVGQDIGNVSYLISCPN